MNVENPVTKTRQPSYKDFFGSLHEELLNKGQFETGKLLDLKDAKLGVSGKVFMEMILSLLRPDPLIGISLAELRRCVRDFKEMMKAKNITPIIVFEGLTSFMEDRTNAHNTISQADIKHVWHQLQLRQKPDMDNLALQWVESRELLRVLDENEIEYVVAPYSHFVQLRFFFMYDYIHAIWCEIDMMLFLPAYQIILTIDFKNDSFTFIDSKKAIFNLSILVDRWNDLPSLIGYAHSSPPVSPEFFQDKPFFTAIRELLSKKLRGNEKHIDHAMISTLHQKFDTIPYVDSNLKTDCFSKKSYPNKIETLNYQLSKEVLFCLSFGIIGRELFEALTRRSLTLRTPLADSSELHLIIEKRVLSHWEKTLGMAAPVYSKLSAAHKNPVFHFLKGTEKRPIPFQAAELWDKKFRLDYIQKAQADGNDKEISFAFVIRLFVDFGKKAEQNPELEATMLENAENFTSHVDLEVHIRLLFLNALEIISLKKRNISLTGGALRYTEPKVEENVLILLETMRGEDTLFALWNSFTPTERTRKFSGDALNEANPDFSNISTLHHGLSKENRQRVLLISRLFCMVNPAVRSGPWLHGHDFDLTQMQCIIDSIQTSFRNLYDACILAVLPKVEGRLSLFPPLRKTAPFRSNISVGLGIVIRDMTQSALENRPYSLTELSKKYHDFVDLEHYLRRGHLIYEAVVKVLEYFKKKGNANDYPSSLVEQYEQGFTYLHNEFKRIGLIKAD